MYKNLCHLYPTEHRNAMFHAFHHNLSWTILEHNAQCQLQTLSRIAIGLATVPNSEYPDASGHNNIYTF